MNAPARLFCKYGPLKGKSFELKETNTIGRKSDNDWVLEHHMVSSHHARIFWDEKAGCYKIEDLDSLNGTRLDGSFIRQVESLGPLHLISFSGHEFFFQILPG
ncbi:MAG: FHA domain-containing protein [Acidobacteria bacterium]|nr:FHA domain-containing protein [Acidobacteriota bacterium]